MKANITKLKVSDSDGKELAVIELDISNSIEETLKKVIQESYSGCTLIFIGNKDSKLDITTLYETCKAVHSIIGDSLEWSITDTPPDSAEKDLDAYLILKNKEK